MIPRNSSYQPIASRTRSHLAHARIMAPLENMVTSGVLEREERILIRYHGDHATQHAGHAGQHAGHAIQHAHAIINLLVQGNFNLRHIATLVQQETEHRAQTNRHTRHGMSHIQEGEYHIAQSRIHRQNRLNATLGHEGNDKMLPAPAA